MKIGVVEPRNGLLQPKVSFDVAGPKGGVESYSGVLDTGFTGWIALPEAEIEKLALNFSHDDTLTLADDRTVRVSLYIAEVFLAYQWHKLFVVQIGSIPLVGTGITSNSRITIDMVPNGDITYAPISP